MTRQEFIAAVAARYPHLTSSDADIAVKLILDAITDAISTGAGVEIRNFGSFSLKSVAARTGRNPKTGVAVAIPATAKPHFKAGKELKERVGRDECND